MKSKAVLEFIVLMLAAVALVLLPAQPQVPPFSVLPDLPLGVQPAQAQAARLVDAWRQVYEQMPDLPRDDQYISAETGQVATTSTLASRLIRYHAFVKGRPPNYRLDWKLTLADYLGVNERMTPETYPGSDTLRTNPMQADREAIARLSRAQRARLVDILVSIFTAPESGSSPSVTPPAPTGTPPRLAPVITPAPVITTPRPGDAQLLMP